jgi:hypothetical protein
MLTSACKFTSFNFSSSKTFDFLEGINLDHLTEADLLLADPATHTHPLGTHPLLAIHPGYDVPHSHPPYNQHPVIDVATGAILSAPGKLFYMKNL